MNSRMVLHTDPRDDLIDDESCQEVEAAGGVIMKLEPSNEETYATLAPQAFAVLNADWKLDAKRIAMLKQCQVISRYGTGVDNIDVQAAKAKGILVANVPSFCSEEVADRTWLLLLACAANLPKLDRSVRKGEWRGNSTPFSLPVGERVLGLAGLGNIALAVARRAQASKMKVIAYDPFAPEERFKHHSIERVELDELLATSDYVSLSCPHTDATHHLIDARRLGLMKQTAVLINCARGGLVDSDALVASLKGDHIAGAGLDVFDPEPPKQDDPLFSLDNVVLTPHTASVTKDAFNRLRQRAVESVVRVLQGNQPINLV